MSASISSAAERSPSFCAPAGAPALPARRTLAKASSWAIAHRETSRRLLMIPSGSEGQPAAGTGDEELAWHLFPHELDEVSAAAMHRDDHVRVQPPDLRHDLVEVL